ncbi:MAG TPA: DUF951 domain-containing protein [Bacilli bacterium]|nr:DUF951 domain-containing protein [Bacilli bacterium]
MTKIEVDLYEEIEMKKAHPCFAKSKRFQVVRLGADLKLQCLGCGNIVMISRINFNKKFKKSIKKHSALIYQK